jgi:hypothetical protein
MGKSERSSVVFELSSAGETKLNTSDVHQKLHMGKKQILVTKHRLFTFIELLV